MTGWVGSSVRILRSDGLPELRALVDAVAGLIEGTSAASVA
jgi:hypothetical protein